MDSATKEFVRRRANYCCEYCGLAQQFSSIGHHIEHIVAKQHGGTNDLENLGLACHRCNLKKGPNLTAIDPASGEIVELFHPRRNRWEDHFLVKGFKIEGCTSIGRATVQLLDMNDARRMNLRFEIAHKI